MRANFHVLARSLTIVIAIAGCAGPRIVNIVDAPVKVQQSEITEEDVKKAIVQAGEGLGWTMRSESLRKLVGMLTVRDQSAIVAIDYDTKGYSIRYRDSTNLGYRWKPVSDYGGTIVLSGTDQGEIHKNYNDWVRKLDAAIKLELSRM